MGIKWGQVPIHPLIADGDSPPSILSLNLASESTLPHWCTNFLPTVYALSPVGARIGFAAKLMRFSAKSYHIWQQIYGIMAANLYRTRKPTHRPQATLTMLEGFILAELAKGKKIDFELVSFYPRLSGALPSRDSSPEAEGLFVRGAVKARRALMNGLKDKLEAVNSISRKIRAV